MDPPLEQRRLLMGQAVEGALSVVPVVGPCRKTSGVLRSVTLNDLERRNGRYRASFSSFGTDYVKVVEDTPILSATEM